MIAGLSASFSLVKQLFSKSVWHIKKGFQSKALRTRAGNRNAEIATLLHSAMEGGDANFIAAKLHRRKKDPYFQPRTKYAHDH